MTPKDLTDQESGEIGNDTDGTTARGTMGKRADASAQQTTTEAHDDSNLGTEREVKADKKRRGVRFEDEHRDEAVSRRNSQTRDDGQGEVMGQGETPQKEIR